MRLIVGLVCGWLICGIAAVWVIIATRDLMWTNQPHWFALGWDVFLLFVAFALPVKTVILIDALSKLTTSKRDGG